MKFRTRKPFKQAENFLTDFQAHHPKDYPKLIELITSHKYGDVDKEDVFHFIVQTTKKNQSLLSKFNSFLNPDRHIVVLSIRKIQRLVSHLFESIHAMFQADKHFDNFLKFFELVSNKMDEENMRFVSFREIQEFFAFEISKEENALLIGPEIILKANEVLQIYIDNFKNEPESDFESGIERKPSVLIEVQPVETKIKKQVLGEKTAVLPVKEEKWVTPRNRPKKAPSRTPIVIEPQQEPEPMLQEPVLVKEVETQDEKKPENLKIELNVFKAIRKKLSESHFCLLIKMVHLFQLNVLSYFEFVKLAQQLLLSVDKKLLLLFREILESREQQRIAQNPFNLKTQNVEINHQTDNFSYNKVYFSFDPQREILPTLINKSYLGIATGNEAVGNFEDLPYKRTHKNVSEEVLFKIEDEIHEFDSNIAQIKVTLGLVGKIQREKLTPVVLNKICAKLMTVRALQLIYGNKSHKIIDKLRCRPKELIDLVLERLNEKLLLLQAMKQEFAEKTWLGKFNDNYYKALDARSNSIKAFERTLFTHKYLLQSLKNLAQESLGVQLSNSLNQLVFNKPEERVDLSHLRRGSVDFWNPLLAFHIDSTRIGLDAVHILTIFLKLSKSNLDKKKCTFFLRKSVLNFLKLDPNSHVSNLFFYNSDQLQNELNNIEKHVYPNKEFYYHTKINVILEKDNPKNFAEILARDFSLSEFFSGEFQNTKNEAEKNGQFLATHQNEDQANPLVTGFPPTSIQPSSNVPVSDYFFAHSPFFVAFRHFFLLFERLRFVYDFSMLHYNHDRLYILYLSLLVHYLFGIIDSFNYENAIITLFDKKAGVLLNIDKILQNFFKSLPNDELYNFLIETNRSIFGECVTSDCEPVLFAKTCQKITEIHSKENKTVKTQFTSQGTTDVVLELLKFEFIENEKLLLVHSFDSIFKFNGKEGIYPQIPFLETLSMIINKPVVAITKRKLKKQRNIRLVNNRVYTLNSTHKGLSFIGLGSEELILGINCETANEKKIKKIHKLQAVVNFQRLRTKRIQIGVPENSIV